MPLECFAYYRVSTNKQGQSGLGLEAQRTATLNYARSENLEVLGQFTEIESGRKSNRPELGAAIEACKINNAVLLIAKLDRLARNVHFISGLLESNIKFIALDMPNADKFMLHVYAAMAEEEARRISERTKAALSAAKRNGVELGKFGKQLAKTNAKTADQFCQQIGPQIAQLRSSENMSYRAIAERFNQIGLRSFRNQSWHTTTIHRLHHRFMSL
ncbi:MAG: recombinase family protein [Cognatishimia sp.]|uniref:recombinase family protein n=1 Tax=Cognatishimia sp. TaxID=2211648 RepID=UPI003B8C53E5